MSTSARIADGCTAGIALRCQPTKVMTLLHWTPGLRFCGPPRISFVNCHACNRMSQKALCCMVSSPAVHALLVKISAPLCPSLTATGFHGRLMLTMLRWRTAAAVKSQATRSQATAAATAAAARGARAAGAKGTSSRWGVQPGVAVWSCRLAVACEDACACAAFHLFAAACNLIYCTTIPGWHM